jgi:hypothetical protein
MGLCRGQTFYLVFPKNRHITEPTMLMMSLQDHEKGLPDWPGGVRRAYDASSTSSEAHGAARGVAAQETRHAAVAAVHLAHVPISRENHAYARLGHTTWFQRSLCSVGPLCTLPSAGQQRRSACKAYAAKPSPECRHGCIADGSRIFSDFF